MDDETGRKVEPSSQPRISGWAGSDAGACKREFRASSIVNGTAQPAARRELRVCRVNDGVDPKGRDIDELRGEAHHAIGCGLTNRA